MPPLNTKGLWTAQIEAVQNLEVSLADDRPRALIQMATGSGKTFTAVSFVYRLIKFAKAKRVLFLVDRNNLGRQALKEFQQYLTPDDGRKFTELYNVQHLQSNTSTPSAGCYITTIQRLYSMLSGERNLDPENEENSLFDHARRSWKPAAQGSALQPGHPHRDLRFHRHGRVPPLHLQPVAAGAGIFRRLPDRPDGHAVQADLRLLQPEPGDGIRPRTGRGGRRERRMARSTASARRSASRAVEVEAGLLGGQARPADPRKQRWEQLDEDLYLRPRPARPGGGASEPDPHHRAHLPGRLFTEIFPGRTEVPKTLVFAKDDSHAEDIVRIVREEFGKGNEFCQKITYRTTGESPKTLIADFRNSYIPRIAVTVDMIATGTDIRPLEILLFMRAVESRRAVRADAGARHARHLSRTDLQAVTPRCA